MVDVKYIINRRQNRYPTKPFTISEPKNQGTHKLKVVQTLRSTDYEALKLLSVVSSSAPYDKLVFGSDSEVPHLSSSHEALLRTLTRKSELGYSFKEKFGHHISHPICPTRMITEIKR